MRTAVSCLLLCAAAFAQSGASPKPAVVEGKCVNSITGEPVRKAELTITTSLIPENVEALMAQFTPADAPAPAAPKAARKKFSATTDAAGKFRIEIEPGDYYFTATHASFVDFHYKPEGKYAVDDKLHVVAADELNGLVFKMTPHGALSGRVVDEDGDPVGGAMVTAQSYSYATGKRRLSPVDTAMADDRGEFRLGKLPPGRYYLTAGQLNMNLMAETPPPPQDGSPETAYVPTYYPKTDDVKLAAGIDVAAGSDLSGFAIQLQKARVVRVKGKAVDKDGAPMKSGQVMLMAPERPSAMRMRMISDPQGQFEFAGVQPGTYIISTVQMGGPSPSIQMQPLVVPSEGIINVQVGRQPEGRVAGSVTVDGDGKEPLAGMSITLGASEGLPMMPVSGKVSETGSFTLDRVGAAAYEVSIPSVPDGAYVQSIQWNGREILGKPLDLTGGFAGSLHVTLATDGGSFEASVTRDDKPAAGTTVVLLPADPASRIEPMTREAETDGAGHVTFKNVRPGSYMVFAWEQVEEGAWFDPEFMKPLENRGVKVTIQPKGSERADLRAIAAK